MSVYVHCCNHSLDLALAEEAKQVAVVSDAMNLTREISNALNTAKRQNLFKGHVIDGQGTQQEGAHSSKTPKKLLSLCPTRWTVRCQAFQRFVENYDSVVATVEDLIEDRSAPANTRSKLRGYMSQLQKFETMFGMKLCLKLFAPYEALARALQRPSVSAGEAIKGANVLLDSLSSMREDGAFDSLYDEVRSFCNKLETEISEPKAPRRVRPPKRLEHSENPAPDTAFGARDALRRHYYQAVDVVTEETKARFDQRGLRYLARMEELLLRPRVGWSSAELAAELGQWKSDFHLELLAQQLSCYATGVWKPGLESVTDVLQLLSDQPRTVRDMLSQVYRLAQLIATVPVSEASAERSFSALRRVKTPYRSTMLQGRLTDLMLLHVHANRSKTLDRYEVLREFVSVRRETRETVFGRL